jgi:hypothetical protein
MIVGYAYTICFVNRIFVEKIFGNQDICTAGLGAYSVSPQGSRVSRENFSIYAKGLLCSSFLYLKLLRTEERKALNSQLKASTFAGE